MCLNSGFVRGIIWKHSFSAFQKTKLTGICITAFITLAATERGISDEYVVLFSFDILEKNHQFRSIS